MDSKYYTPTIDEFYIGFEYERLIIDKWKRFEMTNVPLFIDLNARTLKELLKDNWIRVKYLDKEDIESLGFKYGKTQPGLNEDYFEYGRSELSFEHADYYMDYDYDRKYCRIYFSVLNGDSTIFAGNIKNKSELKVLLKQLGIDDKENNNRDS